MPSFLQKVGSRRIIEWSVAYLAAAWVGLQVVDVLAEVWSLSLALQRSIQVLVGLGLILTIVLAWFHGERGPQRLRAPELALIAGILLIGGFALWRLRGAGAVTRADPPQSATAVDTEDPRPSVAILPFADMSRDGDQAYFADGIAEEILNTLARIPDLRVPARTSAFSFRGAALDVREIGEALGVRHVLEGTLRTDGDSLRITVTLVGVDDGFRVWSDEFHREIGSVFEIQDAIASQVARALEVELVRTGDDASRSTTPEAYQAYLRGVHAFNSFEDDHAERALDAYAEALRLDTSFARARAGIAAANFALGYFGQRPAREVIPIARREARRALRSDESLAEAHAVLGFISLYYDYDRDWAGTEREMRIALASNPNDILARHAYADLLMLLGDGEAGLQQVRLGRQADPLSALAFAPVIGHLYALGRFEETIDEIGTLNELFPGRVPAARSYLAWSLWNLGRYDEALTEWERSRTAHADDLVAVRGAVAAEGARAAMRTWADTLAQRYAREGGSPMAIARRYAWAGARDEAFAWLEEAMEAPTPELLHAAVHPDYAALHGDARFNAFLDRLGIPR